MRVMPGASAEAPFVSICKACERGTFVLVPRSFLKTTDRTPQPHRSRRDMPHHHRRTRKYLPAEDKRGILEGVPVPRTRSRKSDNATCSSRLSPPRAASPHTRSHVLGRRYVLSEASIVPRFQVRLPILSRRMEAATPPIRRNSGSTRPQYSAMNGPSAIVAYMVYVGRSCSTENFPRRIRFLGRARSLGSRSARRGRGD